MPGPLRETASPSGIDLRPQPEKSVRISKRAGGVIVLVGAGVLGRFAYGGLRRMQQAGIVAQGGLYKKVEPARPDELQQTLSPTTRLQAPDPNLPKERVVVRRAPAPRPAPPAAVQPVAVHQPTPEERA